MNRDDIIAMAREAGIDWHRHWNDDESNRLERFAALVTAAERDHARAHYESAVRLLNGIHALLYPPSIKTPDGRTMVFRPKDPDPHQVLQALSDRIRALPDELAAIQARGQA
jgi:hypothetical protein